MTTDTSVITGTQTSSDDTANDNKFLSFCLGHEEYGVEILRVREIIGIIDITPLPQTPEYVKGVINLRGKIIPVIELRSKFSLPSVDYNDETCIVVVEVSGLGGADQFQMGVIVDTVSEVINIGQEHIESAPRFGCSLNTDYILGMGKTKDKVIILLDIDKVLTQEELGGLVNAAEDVPTADPESRFTNESITEEQRDAA